MAQKQFYDHARARQQEKVANTKDMKDQRAVMHKLLNLKPGEKVLDVGAGNGIFAREIAAKIGATGAVTGIDGSDAMIEMASALCPEGTFLKGDATALPVESESFDVATASQLLCFIEDIDTAMAEMFRVLKPKGRLVVLDTDWGSLVWNCRDENLMARAMDAFKHPYADAHVPRTLSRRLEGAGFEITARHTHAIVNYDGAPDTYSQQNASFLKTMTGNPKAFSPTDCAKWATDQAATMNAGDYFFSLNRYIFCAVKP